MWNVIPHPTRRLPAAFLATKCSTIALAAFRSLCGTHQARDTTRLVEHCSTRARCAMGSS
ncbi:hypothetical protein PR001_g14458 [Phytophthora rubi]|uniref:Uncharacterized protein n=1 Tax=Phytophthora rubi TaxID=129364 RepID=A0A6A3LGR4_9STRA|nr:hypothetical protein PR002_g13885 [Phytophthora rubi]KAE9017228.1 hypothetical protein PR001_g14458 [Phytophthora rubi]